MFSTLQIYFIKIIIYF